MNTPANTINVLLVEDDPDYATLVEQWLKAADSEARFVLNWTDSLSAGCNRLTQGGIDVVLLDLTLPDSEGMDTFAALTSDHPNVPVIVLSSRDSESLALETVRRGAENYLVKGACTPNLLSRALNYAVVRHHRAAGTSSQSITPRGRVVGLVGAKGGTGCTTVACTLAAELRRETDASVLLVDFDSVSGLVGFLMGLDSRCSVKYVIENLDRLDASIWNAVVTDTRGIHVLPSGDSAEALCADPGNLARILGFARNVYDWVVVDLARLERYLALKDQITDTLLITTSGIPSLYRAKRTLEAISEFGVDPGQVAVVMNQADEHSVAPGHPDLTKIFGAQVYASLPFDRYGLHRALMETSLPAESSPFRSAVSELARKLAGLGPPDHKRNLTGLFSLFGRSKGRRKHSPLEVNACKTHLNLAS